jgi:hypothetical protein
MVLEALPGLLKGAGAASRIGNAAARNGLLTTLFPALLRRRLHEEALGNRDKQLLKALTERQIREFKAGSIDINMDENGNISISKSIANDCHTSKWKEHAAVKSKNISNALVRSIALTSSDNDAESSDMQISDDFFNKWASGVQDVSDEIVQEIWSRLIAGEARSPGRFSFRTIERLKTIDRNDMNDIQVISKQVIFDDFDKRSICCLSAAPFNVTVDTARRMADIGIIYGVDPERNWRNKQVSMKLDPPRLGLSEISGVVIAFGYPVLYITSSEHSESRSVNLEIIGIPFTQFGNELFDLAVHNRKMLW